MHNNLDIFANLFNLDEVDKQLGESYWSPRDVARINGRILRVAVMKGEYHWHHHPHDGELFLVLKGHLTIETEKGTITLKKGDGTVIPKGVRHKPEAKERTVVLLLESDKMNFLGERDLPD